MNCRTNLSVLSTVFLLLPLLFSVSATAGNTMDVVQSETGFYYTIQKGDTLWDLSRQFNNSPWLWPELWEENDQISNPHWIFPGERIRLYKKSGQQAITRDDSAPVVAAAPPVTEMPVLPVMKKPVAGPYFVYPSIDRVGFIRKPPVIPAGIIFEVQRQKVMISEGDQVYIRPAQDESAAGLIPGSRFTVFRHMPPTDERDSTDTIGTQHYILGIVEVVTREPDLAIANVLKSFRPIRVDDLVMPYIPRPEKISLTASTPGIDGAIIDSEDHSTLTGNYVLAFIDKGRADNIEVGQQYNLYRQMMTGGNGGTLLPPVDFGTILVLHTEQTTSTVIITNSTDSLTAGDHFRTPVH